MWLTSQAGATACQNPGSSFQIGRQAKTGALKSEITQESHLQHVSPYSVEQNAVSEVCRPPPPFNNCTHTTVCIRPVNLALSIIARSCTPEAAWVSCDRSACCARMSQFMCVGVGIMVVLVIVRWQFPYVLDGTFAWQLLVFAKCNVGQARV